MPHAVESAFEYQATLSPRSIERAQWGDKVDSHVPTVGKDGNYMCVCL